ncbi:MAG: hypothetical protein WBK54_05370, partial [Bacilli bacterium]
MNEIRYGNFVPFEGILDGKGHTISSLSIENSTNYAGLFHTIGTAPKMFRKRSGMSASVQKSDLGSTKGSPK